MHYFSYVNARILLYFIDVASAHFTVITIIDAYIVIRAAIFMHAENLESFDCERAERCSQAVKEHTASVQNHRRIHVSIR